MPSIFFTQDNLILATPLIAFCTTWAFFKFIPLTIGIPLIIIVSLLVQARAKFIASRSTDEHIDKTLAQDLYKEEDAAQAQKDAKAQKKQRKAEQKVRERLKAERKKYGNKKDNADDDEDGENIVNFVKGSRKTK